MDVAVGLVIHPAFGGEGSVFSPEIGAFIQADVGIYDGPAPIFIIVAEMVIIFGGVGTVIDDEQNGSWRDLGIVIHKINHLLHVDGLKSGFMKIVHQFLQVS